MLTENTPPSADPQLADLSQAKPDAKLFDRGRARKSNTSLQENCVTVDIIPGVGTALWDSKEVGGEPKLFSPAEWDAFIRGAKDGEFDI